MLVAGGTDGTVRIWELKQGAPSGPPTSRRLGFPITTIAFGRNDTLALGGGDSHGGYIDVVGSPYRSIVLTSAEGDSVASLAFDPKDDTRLLSGSDDGHVDEWDLTAKKGDENVQYWKAAGDRISGLVFSPDGQELVTTSDDQTITFWSGEGRRQGSVQLAAPVFGAAFGRDSGTVAVAGDDGTVTLWNPQRQLSLGWRIDYGAPLVHDVAFARDPTNGNARELAALVWTFEGGNPVSYVDVWHVPNTPRLDLPAPCSPPICTRFHLPAGLFGSHLALSPSGDRLAVATSNDRAVVFDLARAHSPGVALVPTHADTQDAIDVAFDRSGTRVAVAGHDGTIAVWRLDGARPIGEPVMLAAGKPVSTVAFSPTSELLASGGEDGRVELWDITTRKPTVLGHLTDTVNRLAFSRNGLTLAAAGAAGPIVLWDVAKRRESASLTRQRACDGCRLRPRRCARCEQHRRQRHALGRGARAARRAVHRSRPHGRGRGQHRRDDGRRRQRRRIDLPLDSQLGDRRRLSRLTPLRRGRPESHASGMEPVRRRPRATDVSPVALARRLTRVRAETLFPV